MKTNPTTCHCVQCASPNIHELKTWPKFFDAILDGSKTFEVRRNDRGFKIGERLRLREWSPETETYSERVIIAEITYVLGLAEFLLGRSASEDDYVVLGIRKIEKGVDTRALMRGLRELHELFDTGCQITLTDDGIKVEGADMVALLEKDKDSSLHESTLLRHWDCAWTDDEGFEIDVLARLLDSIRQSNFDHRDIEQRGHRIVLEGV